MGGNFSRNKGQRGEREVIKLLQPTVSKVYMEAGFPSLELTRNLSQSQNGGFDIAGLDWLALEVKYQETENVKGWWEQACRQAGVDHLGMPLAEKGEETLVSGRLRVIDDERKTSSGVGRIMIRSPVLFYRSNGKSWKIRIIGRLFGKKSQFRTPVDVNIFQFLAWFELRLREELAEILTSDLKGPWNS